MINHTSQAALVTITAAQHASAPCVTVANLQTPQRGLRSQGNSCQCDGAWIMRNLLVGVVTAFAVFQAGCHC